MTKKIRTKYDDNLLDTIRKDVAGRVARGVKISPDNDTPSSPFGS